MDRMNKVLKQLEAAMRGKRLDDSILTESKELFDWAYGSFVEDKIIDQQDKEALIESAVKLHNRAKTINNPRLAESITYLKAVSAWLLSTYAEKNSKFCILFIRLHCRVASEWIQFNAVDNAIHSYQEALSNWKKLNTSVLDRVLPPIEQETLIKTVFYGYLDLSKLLRTSDDCKWASIRECVGSALEIMPQSDSSSLVMAQHVLELAHYLASSTTEFEESCHYFHIILSILESSPFIQNKVLPDDAMQESLPDESWKREVLLIQIKTFLGLSYVQKELNKCDKALEYVEKANALNLEFSNILHPVVLDKDTFAYAKFAIHCRENNIRAAELSLNDLLEHSDSLDLTLSSVRIFLEGCGACDGEDPRVSGDGLCSTNDEVSLSPQNKVNNSTDLDSSEYVTDERVERCRDLFQKLERKFPSDPENSSIRLVHLKFAYSFSQLCMASQVSSNVACDVLESKADRNWCYGTELCEDLIQKHATKKRILKDDQVLKLLHILQDRVHWLQAHRLYKHVLKTCDILLSILCNISPEAVDDTEPYAKELGISPSRKSENTFCGSPRMMNQASESVGIQPVCKENSCFSPESSNAIMKSPSNDVIYATKLVVYHWKSYACLQLLEQRNNQDRNSAKQLAVEGITLALECALRLHSSRNLLLAVHAILRAGHHCVGACSWRDRLAGIKESLSVENRQEDCPFSPIFSGKFSYQNHGSNSVFDAVDVALTLLAHHYKEKKMSIFFASMRGSVSEKASILSEEPDKDDDARDVCLTTAQEVVKQILKQLQMCCHLINDSDIILEGDKTIALLFIQQAWLSLYHHHHFNAVTETELQPVAVEASDSADHSAFLMSRGPAEPFSCPLSASVLYLSVLCETIGLNLKIHLSTTKEPEKINDRKRKREHEYSNSCEDECEGKQTRPLSPESRSSTKINEEKVTEFVANIFNPIDMTMPLPDCVVTEGVTLDSSSQIFAFGCKCSSLKSQIHVFIKHLLALSDYIETSSNDEERKNALLALGSRDQVLWVADVLWNMGVMLMKKHMCSFESCCGSNNDKLSVATTTSLTDDTATASSKKTLHSDTPPNSTSKESNLSHDDISRFQIGAETLELCQQMYHIASTWPLGQANSSPSSPSAEEQGAQGEERMLNNMASDSVNHVNKDDTADFEAENFSNQSKASLCAIALRLDLNRILGHGELSSKSNPVDIAFDASCDINNAGEDACCRKSPTPLTFSGKNSSSEIGVSSTSALLKANFLHLLKDFDTLEILLPLLLERGMTEDHPIHKLYVMLSLAVRLLLGSDGSLIPTDVANHNDRLHTVTDNPQGSPPYADFKPTITSADFFLANNTSQMLALAPLDLVKCSELASFSQGQGTSSKVASAILRLAVQRIMRDPTPDYALLGNVYRRQVELSSDKGDVLSLLEEFEQLVFSVSPSSSTHHTDDIVDPDSSLPGSRGSEVNHEQENGGRNCQTHSDRDDRDNDCPFLSSDIDCIVTKVFNYSILLNELDLLVMAEKLVSKAMNLLCFTSPTFTPWKDMVRDLYFYILKKKSTVHAGSYAHFVNCQKSKLNDARKDSGTVLTKRNTSVPDDNITSAKVLPDPPDTNHSPLYRPPQLLPEVSIPVQSAAKSVGCKTSVIRTNSTSADACNDAPEKDAQGTRNIITQKNY